MRKLMALLVTLAACTTAQIIPVGSAFEAIDEADVEIVGDRHDLHGTCTTIAYIEVSDVLRNDKDKMLARLRSEAAKIGANYVVFTGFAEHDSNDDVHATAYHCQEDE